MSLVNDMLRDLEQRNEQPTSMPGNQSTVKAAQYVEETPVNNAPRYALWGIGCAAIVMTLWLLWQAQTGQETPIVIDGQKIETVPISKISSVNDGVEEVNSNTEQLDVTQDNAAKVSPESPIAMVAKATSPLLSEAAAINEVKWAGTDFGGDLVVRLKGEADIQVLNQKENIIVIAFDDVVLRTALPSISSKFVRRLDIDVDGQHNRTLLTLTTHIASQFSFRVQQSPTTVILGVIPQQESALMRSQNVSLDDELIAERTVLSPSSETEAKPGVPEKVSSIRSGSDLHVNVVPDEQVITPQVVKPVTKSSQTITDRQVVDRARRAISKGDLKGAEKLLKNLIGQRPNRSEISRGVLATILLSKGNILEAQALVSASLQLYPRNNVFKKLQARIWMADGHANKAVELLEEQIPSIQKDSEYYELMATALQQKGSPERAAKVYYQLLQLNNDVPRWWIGMGYALEQVKRYADARNAYQSGIQIPAIDRSLKNYARQRIQALAGR